MKRTSLAYKSQRRSISPESVSFAIACLIVGVLVSLVLFAWATEGHDPPVLSITPKMEEIREESGQFYVPFSITNEGGETAESVQVLGELRRNGTVTESGEQEIDFLSQGEEEEGAFIFSRDPRQGELVLRVGSYKLP